MPEVISLGPLAYLYFKIYVPLTNYPLELVIISISE